MCALTKVWGYGGEGQGLAEGVDRLNQEHRFETIISGRLPPAARLPSNPGSIGSSESEP